MKKTNLLLAASIAAFLSGCGGGSTSEAEAEAAISGIATPENVVVIQEAAASANLAAANYAAFNDAGTDYADTIVDRYIDNGDWQESINLADSLACVMHATGASNHVNDDGQYLALVKHDICFPEDSTDGQVNWAVTTINSSREDNNLTTPNLVKAYYEIKTTDGDLKVLADVKAITPPTEANPWGEWDLNFDIKNYSDGAYDHGEFSIKKINNDDLSFKSSSTLDRRPMGGESYDWDKLWMNGTIKADRSGGKIQASLKQGWVANGAEQVYKIDFNTTHAAVIKKVGSNEASETCQSLEDFNEYVYRYNIYTEGGSVANIISELDLKYGVNKEKSAWAYLTQSGAIGLSTEDGSKPETVYLKSDTSVSKTVTWPANGSWAPTIANISLDDPIAFNNGHVNNDAIGLHDLTYVGKGNLRGIPWSEASDGRDRPSFNLADGIQLTATNGVTYRIKRTNIGLSPKMVDASNCTGLDASTISFSDPELTNTARDIAWSTKPTVSSEAKVKHGIDQ